MVLFEIHIFVIDILPEPIGYYLIFSGISMLLNDFPIGNKAKNMALALIFISIPTVFIQQNAGADQLGQIPFLSGWSLYITVLGVLKLILVFYIFQLIMVIVKEHGDFALINRSMKTFYTYIIVMVLTMTGHSFAINFSTNQFMVVTIFSLIIGFIMEIVFLVLLRKMRKIDCEG
ncbi:MAG TPA: hypothetical protein GXX18_04010 [Bacillales bacterium]|nr:hypothetical protein [Bacillales bacterium]